MVLLVVVLLLLVVLLEVVLLGLGRGGTEPISGGCCLGVVGGLGGGLGGSGGCDVLGCSTWLMMYTMDEPALYILVLSSSTTREASSARNTMGVEPRLGSLQGR